MKRTKNKVPKKSRKFDNSIITISFFFFLNNQDSNRKPVEPRKRLKTGLFRVWLEKEKKKATSGRSSCDFSTVQASLSRAEFRFPEEVSPFCPLRTFGILFQKFPGMETRPPEHAARDLGENPWINGIPYGINDCGFSSRIREPRSDSWYNLSILFPRSDQYSSFVSFSLLFYFFV